MITEKERMDLKAISEADHAKDIADTLNEKKIRPLRSKLYNARTINRVMRGEQEDMNAEWAIFHFYHQLSIRKKELEELRNGKLTNPPEGENQ